MKKKVLAFYDVMGIQNFIFSTNKLKENIGSSNIVQDILSVHLKDILNNVNNNFIVFEDLHDRTNFLEDKYDALIVYIAGGNAFIIFNKLETAKRVSYELSKKILIETGGLLNLAVAYKETDFHAFKEDYHELTLQIDINKFEFIRTQPLLGIGITKQEQSSGLPTQLLIKTEEDGEETVEFVSYPSYRKRYSADKTHYELEYLGELKNRFRFPRSIDELGQKKGENYIAVVHIDGNEIGNTKHELLNGITDSYEALAMLYNFSKKLNSIFKNSVNLMIKDLVNSFQDVQFAENFRISSNKGKINLPIRPLIMKGDDITFISNGKIGISLAEIFLKKLEQEKQNFKINGKLIEISASCGVAITKTKFPFYRAYELSEELCRSAKIKGKIIEQINNEYFKKGHWIDFHICQSGISDELKDIRRQKYNIAGIERPPHLILNSNCSTKLEYPQYNLLRRPWCIVGESKSEYLWTRLKGIIKNFDMNNWPRNKLAKLKKAFLSSKERVEQFLIEISTDESLNIKDVWEDEITPYFDALEVMNYYIPLIKGENKN